MWSPHRTLHAPVLAVADLGVGSLLYANLSAVLGTLLLVVGVVVLCSVAYETLSRRRSVVGRQDGHLSTE